MVGAMRSSVVTVKTYKLIIAALMCGVVILVAFAAQVLLAR